LSNVLADDNICVGQLNSPTVCDEFGGETDLNDCRSKELAADSVPTLVPEPKVVETERCVALILAVGVDTGTAEMAGASTVNNSEAKLNQNYFPMEDWNDLLESEDQLGPLPSWTHSQSSTAGHEFGLPSFEYGD
jgi:hypothetical protein